MHRTNITDKSIHARKEVSQVFLGGIFQNPAGFTGNGIIYLKGNFHKGCNVGRLAHYKVGHIPSFGPGMINVVEGVVEF